MNFPFQDTKTHTKEEKRKQLVVNIHLPNEYHSSRGNLKASFPGYSQGKQAGIQNWVIHTYKKEQKRLQWEPLIYKTCCLEKGMLYDLLKLQEQTDWSTSSKIFFVLFMFWEMLTSFYVVWDK